MRPSKRHMPVSWHGNGMLEYLYFDYGTLIDSILTCMACLIKFIVVWADSLSWAMYVCVLYVHSLHASDYDW